MSIEAEFADCMMRRKEIKDQMRELSDKLRAADEDARKIYMKKHGLYVGAIVKGSKGDTISFKRLYGTPFDLDYMESVTGYIFKKDGSIGVREQTIFGAWTVEKP